MFFKVDPVEYRILEITDDLCQMIQIDPMDILAKPLFDVFPHDGHQKEALLEKLKDKSTHIDHLYVDFDYHRTHYTIKKTPRYIAIFVNTCHLIVEKTA